MALQASPVTIYSVLFVATKSTKKRFRGRNSLDLTGLYNISVFTLQKTCSVRGRLRGPLGTRNGMPTFLNCYSL